MLPGVARSARSRCTAVPLSLYFHIPFCDSLCWFCGCNTTVVRRYQPVTAYLQRRKREIAAVAKIFTGRRRVKHIHFGGGSPSLLKPKDWRLLFAQLRTAFDIAEDTAIAVEIDPRDLPRENVAALAEVGFNWASFGVQDFDADVQHAINRVQPFDVTARMVEDGLAQAEAGGRLRRNFQGYTDDPAGAFIGFGASAISSLPQGYVQNTTHTPAYNRAIDSGGLAAERGFRLGPQDVLRRGIIESLMCHLSVDLNGVGRASEALPPGFAAELGALEEFRRDGLIEIADGRVGVTPLGRPLLRVICAAFDSYLKPAESRHSRAI